jgi:nicotinate-nucleotide--dimethylbenzimidazole phosphoribosyltransferase
MTAQQVDAALAAGIAVFEENIWPHRYDVLAVGEMGISNSTSASAIVAALTDSPIDSVTGRGTGVDDAGLARKAAVLRMALARCRTRDWRTVAREVGGFEIVGLTGVILAAARRRTAVILDGFITSASALLAREIAPQSQGYFVAAHRSQEPGHRIALAALELEPLLDLELRLGEGTGAALALPLIESATRMISEMKTFAEASVATRIT